MRQLIIVLFCLVLSSCVNDKINYQELASCQDHTIPDLKNEVQSVSRVLVVVPHADDEIAASGLILYFREKGATAHLLTLCNHEEPRQSELKCAAETLGFEKYENAGFINNEWEDIIENKIVFWNDNKTHIKTVIQEKIKAYKPDAIITYDSQMGATGHPEHLISAQIVEGIFKENNDEITFGLKYLFQITLPQKLEKILVAETKMYKMTKYITQASGLPRPNVALDIKKYWPIKNKAGFCHQSQIHILKKVYMVYDKENMVSHINTFAKEYYKMLKLKKNT
ncbi:PIG-L family deacetylase [Aquimarina gracilis]|uniref:PIG-L family deacetylase n=1 Tax=Aquimarina gracilis TaxID=874422 RepID=A0ABU5ZR46_9FLAO|nr:PIG-L family deacetylase [Aquimarina gracilis]MEB3344535.1 PIG-L family deacetylase [Aquimarina gracilis]